MLAGGIGEGFPTDWEGQHLDTIGSSGYLSDDMPPALARQCGRKIRWMNDKRSSDRARTH
jgi:hypothetical protein